MYGDGDAQAAAAFAGILDDAAPDVVHVHAFTRGASLRLVRAAKSRGIPVVFSYHTPTVSCQRGTLLRWGTDVCDGALDVTTCAACALHAHGLRRPLANLVAGLPRLVRRAVRLGAMSSRANTALQMTELVALRHDAFHALMAEVDAVVALCDWVKAVLLRNGVPPSKIVVSRQGLSDWNRDGSTAREERRQGSPLRVAFFGRLDPTKGIDVLIDAVRSAPDLPVTLDVFGVVQGDGDSRYVRTLRARAAADSRISFRAPVSPREVVTHMRRYDLVAVPSQWLETGPLVVMEAFAAGTPVIGSDLGGIAELVRHDIDGLRVDPQRADAWRAALTTLYDDPQRLARLRRGIARPRTIADVARDMSTVYARFAESADASLVLQAV